MLIDGTHEIRPQGCANFYWESHINLYNAADVSIPAAVSVFPGENYQAPRSWTERAYQKLIYYNKVNQGGHYAAWNSRNSFHTRFALASDHCANRYPEVRSQKSDR